MLDAFIIEEINRREQKQEIERDKQRPRQELPVPKKQPLTIPQDQPGSDIIIIPPEGETPGDITSEIIYSAKPNSQYEPQRYTKNI